MAENSEGLKSSVEGDGVRMDVEGEEGGTVKKADANAPVSSSSGVLRKEEKVSPKKGLSFLEYSSKRASYCGIPSCGKRSERLTFATSSALVYYGIKDRLAILKICSSCQEKANEYRKKSIEAIRKGEPVFNVRREPQGMVPETVDLDDDENMGAASSSSQASTSTTRESREYVEVDFDRKDVETIVKGIMNKFNIKEQLHKCKRQCEDEANQLEKDMKELEETMQSVDDKLYQTCKQYNDVFDKRPKPIIIEEVEINADGRMRRRNLAGDDSVFVNTASLKKLAEKFNQPAEVKPVVEKEESREPAADSAGGEAEKEDLNQSIISLPDVTPRKPGPASKTRYYDVKEAQQSGPFDRKIQRPPELRPKKEYSLLPTPTVIPRIRPKVGDIIYAMNKNLLHLWLKAEVLEVVFNDTTNQTEFVVHYEPTRNNKPTGGVEGEGTVRLIRQLCLKQMAYNLPCPFVLPVGSRVIGRFKEEFAPDPETDGQYYAGIVAEPPKAASKYRYLIFFDDGYAQYVHTEDVLLVCESSKLVWNDIYPDSYDFIKDYVTRWPNWPMVKLHLGSLVATEWNGKWLVSRILEVDNCLARVRFENDGREEWIYRGSTRFRPVYRIFEKEENAKQNSNSKENKIPRHDPEEYKNRKAPAIEYKGEDINTMQLVQKIGARKSTGRCQYYDELQLFTGLGGIESNWINMLDPDLCIEYQGTLSKIKIPQDAPQPKDYVTHTCSHSCVIAYVPSKELKRLSPLSIPFHFGWNREVSRAPRHVVFYKSPCGVRIRDASELAKYLDMTDSNLSIDYFCFDYAVDCLSEFVPARALRDIKDISYGKEGAPVQCINSVDYEDLPYMEYTPNRILGPDVKLNTDENFLVCCDCTDNCQDKTKCACWKLTLEGIAFTKLNDENNPVVGYENRRLKDHIVSGIFECNNKCKCKKTCSNRVVQNGVQWPLQIFKTTKKGWGIRAVYDMPEGTFICIYAGQILNDQTANEDGKEFGDEYLAELDYIECNEAVKEDYESEAEDIEAEDFEEDREVKKKVSKDKKKRRRVRLFEDDEQDDDGEDADEEDSESEKNSDADDADFVTRASVDGGKKRMFATRRTNGQKKNFDPDSIILNDDDDMITARVAHFSPRVTPSSNRKRRRILTRDFFGPNEQCYIMDAKSKGNIGRYLNHSCCPNVFVQNVFVDTHDIRFPMVAFFTNSHVRAGTELTWDYHYQIGSVPGKVLYCFCMTPYCRGRLL